MQPGQKKHADNAPIEDTPKSKVGARLLNYRFDYYAHPSGDDLMLSWKGSADDLLAHCTDEEQFIEVMRGLYARLRAHAHERLADTQDHNNDAQDPTKNTHDLTDFLTNAARQMKDDYQYIKKRSGEDPGTAGDQGEENWAHLLRGWLPEAYYITTKGRIVSRTGKPSPQIDIIVLDPAYPPALRPKKMYLADGVIAAFECKITLESTHLAEAMTSAAAIKRLATPHYGSPYRELNSSILFGLLAHSHEWKLPNSKPRENIRNAIYRADRQIVKHPREMIDIICISDLTTWSTAKWLWDDPSFRQFNGIERGKLTSATYTEQHPEYASNVEPIAVMINSLIRKVAWRDHSLRPLARYFMSVTKSTGLAHGRAWQPEIFSESVREKVNRDNYWETHREVLSELPIDDATWNEWNTHLP